MELGQEISLHYENIRLKNMDLLSQRKNEIYRKIPDIKNLDAFISELALKSCREIFAKPDSSLVLEATQEISELKDQKRKILKAKGYPENYLDMPYDCHICKDTGFLEDGSKCSCLKKLTIDKLYKNSNLSHVLLRENFSTFNINLFSDEINEREGLSPRANIKKITDLSKNFIITFKEDNDFNLLFYGPTGQGKTFMINCIAKELMDRNVSVIYLTAYEMIEVLENKKFKKIENLEYSLLFDSELLIVDDLGIELITTFTNSEIFNIINTRLIRGKKTIISTNLSPKELSKTYTDRVFSRVFQKFTPLKFFGEDLRWQRGGKL
ncbi:ATP-binding protein [uncultured Peptoniphilus sp.]|uniref:ATP-binding protein n=2 Tax=Peptoniphilus TaxID=162289 RepID=UPI00280430EF|nr:ATP-binding protein [uncultured Peptoniphilus sp.]